jgi:hypothetical protein
MGWALDREIEFRRISGRISVGWWRTRTQNRIFIKQMREESFVSSWLNKQAPRAIRDDDVCEREN